MILFTDSSFVTSAGNKSNYKIQKKDGDLLIKVIFYSLYQQKVYTCINGKYSKSRGTKGKVGGVPHSPLSWS